jgi:sulfotransferase family protein
MGSEQGEQRFAFVFVFQQGMLETAALLLAASLKRFLRCDYELIAAVPAPAELWGEPTETGRRMLAEMGARFEEFTNEFGRSRPNSNKTYCLQVQTDADKLVLLDSDILCLREFRGDERFAIPLNLVPGYARSFEGWDDAYRVADVPVPSIRLPTLLTKELTLPWFNSGFVAVASEIPLGETWLECERMLVADDSVTVTARQLQVSLAVAVMRLGVPYDCLDERYNHPVFAKRIDPQDPPYFAHYGHWGGPILQHEPVLEETAASLVDEHPELLEVMAGDPHWSGLAAHLENGRRRKGRERRPDISHRPAQPADLVITGIAASGAGYLSELISSYSNCVVLREPGGRVHNALRVPVPWPLAIFYSLERVRLLGADSLIPAETETGPAEVTVDDDDFVLATASTHRYLARLDGLHRALPHARILVCVRDPFETIASWKRFLDSHPVGQLDPGMVPKPDDPWLTAAEREVFAQLQEAAPPQQLAMVWQHFAELILNERDRVTLVRFADLVADPQQTVAAVLEGMSAGKPAGQITASQHRGDRASLDEADQQAIGAICSQAAFELGLVD